MSIPLTLCLVIPLDLKKKERKKGGRGGGDLSISYIIFLYTGYNDSFEV